MEHRSRIKAAKERYKSMMGELGWQMTGSVHFIRGIPHTRALTEPRTFKLSKYEKISPLCVGYSCCYSRQLCRCFAFVGSLQLCLPELRTRRVLSLSYINVFPSLETVVQVLIKGGVSHLIGSDSRVAYHGVYVGMRMSIDPNIYPAVSDELTQLGREC